MGKSTEAGLREKELISCVANSSISLQLEDGLLAQWRWGGLHTWGAHGESRSTWRGSSLESHIHSPLISLWRGQSLRGHAGPCSTPRRHLPESTRPGPQKEVSALT